MGVLLPKVLDDQDWCWKVQYFLVRMQKGKNVPPDGIISFPAFGSPIASSRSLLRVVRVAQNPIHPVHSTPGRCDFGNAEGVRSQDAPVSAGWRQSRLRRSRIDLVASFVIIRTAGLEVGKGAPTSHPNLHPARIELLLVDSSSGKYAPGQATLPPIGRSSKPRYIEMK
jgi:hypothetical protein